MKLILKGEEIEKCQIENRNNLNLLPTMVRVLLAFMGYGVHDRPLWPKTVHFRFDTLLMSNFLSNISF